MKGLKIVSTSRCLPERVVTNDDMSKRVDTSDEWIRTRTGIGARRFVSEGESNADLAVAAARIALERAGVTPEQLCACVVCTVSPDHLAPTTACLIQRRLGLPQDFPCFDMNVGCTGFIYGLQVVRGLLAQDRLDRPYALLVGSETLSRLLDFDDRSTCVLFGDGAGAVLLALEESRPYYSIMGAQGGDEEILIDGPTHPKPVIHMDGQPVFRFAVDAVERCIHDLLRQSGLTLEDIDWFIPHQANLRIITYAAKRLKIPMEKFYVNMERYGNTSAASIPIAMDEMSEQGLLVRGQKLICVGFGAGLTWGGTLLEW